MTSRRLPFSDDYRTPPPADGPRDSAGVLLAMHEADADGDCMWCHTPHPCQRLREATGQTD